MENPNKPILKVYQRCRNPAHRTYSPAFTHVILHAMRARLANPHTSPTFPQFLLTGAKLKSRTIPNLWLRHFKHHSTIRVPRLDKASFSATVEFSIIPAIECVHQHRYILCSIIIIIIITNVEILCYATQQMEYVYKLLPMP